ncbi:insulinase family protein [bacterium]|nr:insulinase family protein [bacterium]
MIEHHRETLPNGLRVIYAPMPRLHSANAVVCVRMGPRFETRETNGLSHFVEHMCFKGTERYPDPEAFAHAIDAIGAELNGATEPEHTEFIAACHHRHFLRGLELLAELVLRPRFDPDHVDIERRVVLEELGQYHDALGVNMGDLTYELMWPRHGHHFACLGVDDTVARFTADDIRRHYQRHLTARNVVVCVAGNFDEAAVRDVLAEQFGHLPSGEPLACPALEHQQDAARVLVQRGRTRRVAIRLTHKACPYTDPRHYALLVASEVLGGGVTSRLFARLREREGLVYDVSAGTTLYSDCGWVDVATTTSPRHAEAALGGVLEEIRRLADEGVGHDLLHTIKERSACQMEILEDSPMDVAEWFAVREVLFSPETLASPTAEAERLKTTTVDDVRQMAREVFLPARRSLVFVGPSSWGLRRRLRTLAAR